MFEHDTTGVTESGDFKPIPAGTYVFRIGEKKVTETRNGDPLVRVELIVNEGRFEGKKVFHQVAFLPKMNDGAGIAKRWLHAIGEEYEGKITVNPSGWSGTVKCDVKIEEYTKRDGSIAKTNRISVVHLPDAESIYEPTEPNTETDDVGF
jgi:hypothetical protein